MDDRTVEEVLNAAQIAPTLEEKVDLLWEAVRRLAKEAGAAERPDPEVGLP